MMFFVNATVLRVCFFSFHPGAPHTKAYDINHIKIPVIGKHLYVCERPWITVHKQEVGIMIASMGVIPSSFTRWIRSR